MGYSNGVRQQQGTIPNVIQIVEGTYSPEDSFIQFAFMYRRKVTSTRSGRVFSIDERLILPFLNSLEDFDLELKNSTSPSNRSISARCMTFAVCTEQGEAMFGSHNSDFNCVLTFDEHLPIAF
ncbi:unnamed protein product [Rhizopus stolonifer]